jgi:TPR repeat protein
MKRIPSVFKAGAASPFKKPRKTAQAAASSSQPPTPVWAASQTVLNTAPDSEYSRMDIKTESDLLYITGKKLYLSEVISDRNLGFEWLKQAAIKGHQQAQNHLGGIYLNSQGVPQDYYQAISWFEKAAVQGNLDAQKNLQIAIESLERKAIQEANPEDQYLLGTMYHKGQDVLDQVIEWYKKAADQGHEQAQNHLGTMYHKIQGVLDQAIEWYKKAADQGHEQAQNHLGLIYLNSQGVPEDYYQAISWFKKAAVQGNLDAQNNLWIAIESLERKAIQEANPEYQYLLGTIYLEG